jgi:hypothetical protein
VCWANTVVLGAFRQKDTAIPPFWWRLCGNAALPRAFLFGEARFFVVLCILKEILQNAAFPSQVQENRFPQSSFRAGKRGAEPPFFVVVLPDKISCSG